MKQLNGLCLAWLHCLSLTDGKAQTAGKSNGEKYTTYPRGSQVNFFAMMTYD
jgi:hypothetical protein